MDASSNQPTPAPGQNQAPAHRDMMFCHECNDEWYRDEHGLTCPECGSDFTEIIEENNDPRDSGMFGDHDDDESMRDFNPHLFRHHDPSSHNNDDPEEGDISNVHFTQTAPGRFNVQATITRSVSPQQFRAAGGIAPASIGGFMAMLNGLTGAALRTQQQQQQQQPSQQQGQGEGLFSGSNQDQARDQGQDQDGHQTAFQEAQNPGMGPQFRTARYQYHGGARLFPRDANNPEPRMEPVDDLTNVVSGLMAVLGAPPVSIHAQQPPTRGEDPDRPGHVHPAHPFLQLFSTLGMVGPTGQMGDFVYSQEGLDRIITQLMEQTATSNAPGPASQDDIAHLPRKKVDEEMLGAEHTAECSICMDEVNLGEEVTVLPCKHWFHHACVSAWLQEHDTCPHCRKGISSRPDAGNHNQTESNPQTSAQTQDGGGSRAMPGSFDF